MQKPLLIAKDDEAFELAGDFTVRELIEFLRKLPQDVLVSLFDCQNETVIRLIAVQQATLCIGGREREEVLLWVDKDTKALPVRKS